MSREKPPPRAHARRTYPGYTEGRKTHVMAACKCGWESGEWRVSGTVADHDYRQHLAVVEPGQTYKGVGS